MINTKTNDFINSVVMLINDSGLPAVNIRLALQAIMQQVSAEEARQINEEKKTEVNEDG